MKLVRLTEKYSFIFIKHVRVPFLEFNRQLHNCGNVIQAITFISWKPISAKESQPVYILPNEFPKGINLLGTSKYNHTFAKVVLNNPAFIQSV
jgi:hypothetical protein